MKNVYLLCNAHLDPMWLWEWEEGAAAAVSTFRSAVTFCEEYDAFIFNHNEVLLYQWIEEYEPELFERIKIQVKRGKWDIMGGWYLQPDCLMPSGEGFVRQIFEGNKYFEEKFGVTFKTAVNFDSFGHTRGLVQIMAKFGYENYLVCRPTKNDTDLPNEFEWKGFDGSTIRTRRHYELYNSALGKAAEKIKHNIESIDEGESLMILWGVGNHGGGPSRKDIEDIDRLIDGMKEHTNVMHSTPDEYFQSIEHKKLAEIDYSLTPCNTGCLSSMSLIKKYYRELENLLFSVEKMASVASLNGLIKNPAKELHQAVTDMIFIQFHDILPGSALKEVERAGLRRAEHGLEILTKLRAKCFFALSKGLKAKDGTYPVLVFNHHPYKYRTTVECEFQLADQNWNDTFTLMKVYDQNGVELSSQIEKESCNLNLDWRKRVVFNAELEPMSMNMFTCEPYVVNEPRKFKKVDECFEFESNGICVKIQKSSGLITCLQKNGKDLIKSPITFAVHNDTEDPWAMQRFQYSELGEKIGEFKLVSDKESREFAHIKSDLGAVHIIENGPIRTTVEAIFKYNNSFLVTKYILNKINSNFQIDLNVIWSEKDKNLKLEIPMNFDFNLIGETAFGWQELKEGGLENDMQKWCLARGEESLGIINFGNYAVSFKADTIGLTILRSPAYTGHPINDREILHQDRYTPRIDMGERNFRFMFLPDADLQTISQLAQVENEKPFALSFFPNGSGQKIAPLSKIDSKSVLLIAQKNADSGDGVVFRLFNSLNTDNSCSFKIPLFNIDIVVDFVKFELKTLILQDGILYESDLKEKVRRKI